MARKPSDLTITDQFCGAGGSSIGAAAHGFRLARQGAELLRTGKITFPRPDREHLSAIRYGKVYRPDEIDRCVSDLTAATQELDQAFLKTVLPAKADFDRHGRAAPFRAN